MTLKTEIERFLQALPEKNSYGAIKAQADALHAIVYRHLTSSDVETVACQEIARGVGAREPAYRWRAAVQLSLDHDPES